MSDKKSKIVSYAKLAAKLAFAAALIVYLVRSGKLDFKLINEVLKTNRWIYAIIIVIAQIASNAYRWKQLIELKSSAPVSLGKVFSVTWIGLFFNSFLPGAVTGDFIKVYYAKKLNEDLTKTYLLLSAFMDRFLGLMGLLMLMGSVSLIQYGELSSRSTQLKNLVHFNGLMFLAALAMLSTIFLGKKIQDIILNLTRKVPVLGEKVAHAFEQIWLMGSSPKVVIKCIFLSLLGQTLNILCFYTMTSPFYSESLSFLNIFTFVPLGLIATAIPITPAGIGVGHAAFDKLFQFYNIQNGASLFNVYIVIYLVVNSFGLLPFITSGKKPQLSELEDMESAAN